MIRVDSASWTGRPSEVVRDEWGISDAFNAALWRDMRREDLRERVRAFWFVWAPKSRDEEWTRWRAAQATAALLLGRFHSDAHQARLVARWHKHKAPWLDKEGRQIGWRDGKISYPSYVTIASWDFHHTYGGWDAIFLHLHPGWRVSIEHDGDSNL